MFEPVISSFANLAQANPSMPTNSLTVKYTAAHPNLGTFSIGMTGPGGPYTFTPGGGGTAVNRFGTATNDFNIADLEDCAYIVELTVNLLLTTGDSNPSHLSTRSRFARTSLIRPEAAVRTAEIYSEG